MSSDEIQYVEWYVILRGTAEQRAELEKRLVAAAVELGMDANVMHPVSDGDATDVQEAPEH